MNLYIAAGASLVIALLSWQLKSALNHAGELEADLKHQVSETNECVSVNELNRDAVERLNNKIAELDQLRRSEAKEREAVLVRREEELTAARTRAAQLERERRNEIESNPACAEIMSISIRDVCPDATFQLRQRAIGEGRN